MKYVAFLDILGFKNTLDKLDHNKAQYFIKDFSNVIYKVFQYFEHNTKFGINGFVVSDSLVLYSKDTSKESLVDLIKVIEMICRNEFIDNGILIRGGLAKGYFDKIKATELLMLEKTLIVGESYVKAYKLEGSAKVIGIILSNDVYQDILNFNIRIDKGIIQNQTIKSKIITQKNKNQEFYLLKYIDLDFLLDGNNLNRFIDLANKSKWLEHYYNALYFAIQKERSAKKKEKLFVKIENIIIDSNKNSDGCMLDIFIENAFKDGVVRQFQVYFLKHIRKNLICIIKNKY